MMSFSSAYAPQSSTVPPPSAPGISGVLPGQQAVNTTRVLSLTGFSKDLKTRDIQAIFVDYEDDRGGYRIKWLDDTGCLIVFNDPLVAKRAFLNLTANPHPHLMPVISKDESTPSTFPKLVPYEGDDVPNVVASVATRPRSRSIAQNNGASTGGPNGSPAPATGSTNHYRRMSNSAGAANARNFGRPSMSQYQMQAIMDDASSAAAPTTPSKNAQVNGNSAAGSDAVSPTGSAKGSPPSTSGGAIDWGALQQQAATQASRARTSSHSNAATASGAFAGQAFSPPTSPERGIGLGQRAGAVSPSTMRRLVSSNRG